MAKGNYFKRYANNNCLQCGEELTGRQLNYCSKSCRQKAWYSRGILKAGEVVTAPETAKRNCWLCGKPVKVSGYGLCCSKECSLKIAI